MRWKPDAISGEDFEFISEPTKVGSNYTFTTCLTKNEKHLLVGSDKFVSVVDLQTQEVIKKIDVSQDFIKSIKLIKNGESAVIAQEYGGLATVDLTTFEKISEVRLDLKGNELIQMTVI